MDEELNTEALKDLNPDAHPHSLLKWWSEAAVTDGDKQVMNMVIILDELTSGLDKRSMHRVVDQPNL